MAVGIRILASELLLEVIFGVAIMEVGTLCLLGLKDIDIIVSFLYISGFKGLYLEADAIVDIGNTTLAFLNFIFCGFTSQIALGLGGGIGGIA